MGFGFRRLSRTPLEKIQNYYVLHSQITCSIRTLRGVRNGVHGKTPLLPFVFTKIGRMVSGATISFTDRCGLVILSNHFGYEVLRIDL